MASGTFTRPGGNNTFVPDHDATGNLVVEYSRNPDDFALNQYVQITDVTKSRGFYLEINPEEAARVIGADLAEFVWPDGSPRPQTNAGTEQFRFSDYECERYNYDFTIGDLAGEQADWDIIQSHTSIKAQQAMTARTQQVHNVLQDNTAWPAGNTATTTVTGGGTWDGATTADPRIKKSLNYAAEAIMKATLSVVRRKDLVFVMSPEVAHLISVTQEIVDHIKGSPDAYNQIIQYESKFGEYQLPDKLYGIQLAVEDATRVTNKRGAARATTWMAHPDESYLLARPGGLVSPSGGPNFSTMHLFIKEDMSVETRRDEDDRRTEGHVVDHFDAVMTAPASGFRFTDVSTAAAAAAAKAAANQRSGGGRRDPNSPVATG